ncbi:MAG: uncharacterized protein QOJ07_3705 [Thermoleophilaceae bacterium]|jgi:DUF917 family protein|nr:uncharacterized protein [Thermoleophilaceae bacterium]
MLERIDASNLEPIARGCALLAAGGGGAPELTRVMAECATAEHGPVSVVSLDDLDDDALVMPCGLVGAPTIATERLWSGDEGRVLVEAVEQLHTSPVAALLPFQIGGAGGLLAVAWAARLRLPVVDADGMGRTFPRLTQQAMRLAGVPASPVALTDGRGNGIVLHAVDDLSAERLAERTAVSLGGVCAVALYVMSTAVARTATIQGSLSHALAVGEGSADAPATLLAEGRVTAIERGIDDGILSGWVTVRGTGDDARRELRLETQNEYLLAIEDGELLATVPDIISVLALETGDPVPTEDLRLRERVAVVAAPAPGVWTTRAGLRVAGPAAFGYDVPYASPKTAA